MHNFLKTIEHTLGVFFILGIFSIAALGVWSLSPITKADNTMVAGIQTSDVVAIDGLRNIDIKYSAAELTDVTSQLAKLEDGSYLLRVKAQQLVKGENTIGVFSLVNTNLFNAKLNLNLTSLDSNLIDQLSVVINYRENYQLNHFGSNKLTPVQLEMAASEDRTAVLKVVTLDEINFPVDLEISIK